MLAKFFIERPIFAWVISIVIVFAGAAAVFTLPIAQYPEITPPTVQVTCNYPGANAVVVQDTVAAPIEQQVNGVENMLYMSSQCTNDGGYTLTVTFKLGTNLDMAQVLVQNRVALAMPQLPDAVKATGVSTKKKSPSILLCVNLYSDTDEETNQPIFDQLYLSNYATIYVKDELARLDGVGDVTYLGQQDYSMRAWLDPERMAALDMTADDIVGALKEQNVQVAAGRIGQPPIPKGQDFQYILSTLGRLTDQSEFEQIIVKTGTSGQVTRLGEVARLERGAKNQDTRCTLDGKPSVALAIFQLPGSNAIETAERVRAKMTDLEKKFKAGLHFAIVYDTTPFIKESVHEVFKTLRDAVVLVAIVVLFFLQDWKSMILPMIDVPVSLIGTLAVMAAIGFTLNNLTLFGLVLAIGIVVDDAIVVLENIERWLAKGLDAKSATIKAMDEITGPIIGITLVLSSVFLPSAFLTGISGQFYRQFAITISASMIISAINAMTMTPARAVVIFKEHTGGTDHSHITREALPWWGYAALLGWLSVTLLEPLVAPLFGLAGKPAAHGEAAAGLASQAELWGLRAVLAIPGAIVGWLMYRPANKFLSIIFKGFNRFFDWITGIYGWIVGRFLRLCIIVLIAYGGLLGLTYLGLTTTPIGFIPNQDKGYLVVDVQLPDAASLERSIDVMRRIDKIVRETKGVAHTLGVPGQSLVLNAVGSNFGSMYIILDEFEHRRDHDRSADAIIRKLRGRFLDEILEARTGVFGAPPIDGLGTAGGFKFMVEDKGDVGLATLQGQTDNLIEKGNATPGLVGLFTSFRSDTPQLYIDIDRTKCKTMGVPLSSVFNALQVFLGGFYVNDFNEFGRTWQVNLQADQSYRNTAEDIQLLKVRNVAGEMIPLGTVATVRDVGGPVMITRYNMYRAASINGASLPGFSTGQVLSSIQNLSDTELPKNMGYEWTEIMFLQTLEGSAAAFAFLGAVILVFNVLAAQYESWSMPMAVLLVVPMCLLSAVAGIIFAKMDINIFVQVGFIVLIGLAAKNAILIVEFARAEHAAGKSRYDSAIAAAKERLRPIIMTSFAFILGVFPLVIGHGAGAEMRQTLGTAVFSGMIGVTLFGIFLTPVFYYVIQWFNDPKEKPASGKGSSGH